MLYPYIEFQDGTSVNHTQILEKDGQEVVEVHFERPMDNDLLSARCELPTYNWLYNTGFSKEDIKQFEDFLAANAHLIFKYARNGGIFCA